LDLRILLKWNVCRGGALFGSLYPVQIRSTATNTIFNFGRAIGGFSPILVGYILQSYDMKVAVLYLAALYSISFIVMIMLKNRKKTEDKLKNKG
jgi:dipeptide/tripeptide permease